MSSPLLNRIPLREAIAKYVFGIFSHWPSSLNRISESFNGFSFFVISPEIRGISKLRNAGIQVSDRRAVKLQRLIAASALLCKRNKAILSDMWVLRYIWDTEEQREIIEGIVNGVIEAEKEEAHPHPRALVNALPNADDIYKEVSTLAGKWESPDVSMAERTIIKDRLRYLNGRCQWIDNQVQRQFVQAPIDELWQKIIHTA